VIKSIILLSLLFSVCA